MRLFTLIVCCLPLWATAQTYHNQLSAAAKEHILDDPFTVVSGTEAIPPNVKQAFSTVTGESSFELANPGQKYRATDIVDDRKFPLRRLIFAGVKADKWFIHYERGGRGHGYYVLVFKVDPEGRIQFLWGGAGLHRAGNVGQLRKLVAGGQFSDHLNYYW